MAGRQADTRYFPVLKKASSRVYLGVIKDVAHCEYIYKCTTGYNFTDLGNTVLELKEVEFSLFLIICFH